MDVCRYAVSHVGTGVVVASSWTNDTPLFRTQETQEIQPGRFRAKLVIFAQMRMGVVEDKEQAARRSAGSGPLCGAACAAGSWQPGPPLSVDAVGWVVGTARESVGRGRPCSQPA